MNTPDQSFNKWKEEMRQDALENELKRIKHFSTKQSGKIQRLRRVLLFLSLFIIVLFSMLVFNGFLVWPNPPELSSQNQAIQPDSKIIDKQENAIQPSLYRNEPLQVLKPNQDTLSIQIPKDGILFSVQIGAYTIFDLKEFSDNLVSIHQKTYDGINQFSLGVFQHYPKATKFLEIVKKIGFKDAYVMATRFGKRIQINEALMTRQKGNQQSNRNTHKMSMSEH